MKFADSQPGRLLQLSASVWIFPFLCILVGLLDVSRPSGCVAEEFSASDSGATSAADRQWWAFQPLANPSVPVIEGDKWSSNPIDRFIYRRQVEHDIQPAPRAKNLVLIRRLYFDLIGLPPTREEIDDFVNDPSPDVWSQLVDRLLEDDRYGEHWARFWLDLVRYAESDGWNKDSYRPHIWRYRDYVVKSFNEDKPYPDFVREQIAGDEMHGDDPAHVIATGFLRLGIYEYNQRDARSHWNDIMNEITDVVGDVFFGLSMSCSRCHDHKFDPLLQADYYNLRAFFEPLVWRDDIPGATKAQQATWHEQRVQWEQATADIQAQIDALLKPYYYRKWESTVNKFPVDIQACFHKPQSRRTSWEHQMAYLVSRQFLEEGNGPLNKIAEEDKKKLAALEKQLVAFDEMKPKDLPAVMAATDFAGAIAPTVLPDDSEQRPVEPSFLTVFAGRPLGDQPQLPSLPDSSGRRTALAQWIGRADNPLTMRVIVNRIWQQHFGQGIVSTASDFGHMGQLPSHPELLDWLATTFVENGWSMKHLHRLILNSSTWQQSAHHPQATENSRQDPTDSLIWRARVRRLQAEQFRDAMLVASGELDCQIGGPSVDAAASRRALYVKSFRNTPCEFLHAFDVANGLTSCSQRNRTTTPIQSLLLINGDFALEQAAKLAERVKARHFPSVDEALRYVFQTVWARGPTEAELAKARQFVNGDSNKDQNAIDEEKFTDFCHVLFNSNEFLYLD